MNARIVTDQMKASRHMNLLSRKLISITKNMITSTITVHTKLKNLSINTAIPKKNISILMMENVHMIIARNSMSIRNLMNILMKMEKNAVVIIMIMKRSPSMSIKQILKLKLSILVVHMVKMHMIIMIKDTLIIMIIIIMKTFTEFSFTS